MAFRRIIRRAADATFESRTESAKDNIAGEVLEEMRKKGYIFVNKEENVWKGVNTEKVRKEVRDRLRKSVYFGKQSTVTGKRKAGDDNDAGIECKQPSKQRMTGSLKAGEKDDACIECNKPSKERMTGSKKAGDEDDACIECNKPSKHSCRKCKKHVCSMCCNEKRKLENTWWCNVCFNRQSVWKQTLIRDGNYSTSDEECKK
ncbi:hypothetical protein MHU86_9065 [Fragilaria crotonensis]|nr:hypothetical protein MHU86_9065 [Fragilaria crotonensis]